MNKVYKSKWSAALGAWVACPEIAQYAAKGAVAAAVVMASVTGHAAVVCTPDANGAYLPGNTAPPCDTVPATSGQLVLAPGATHYVLTRSRLTGPVTVAIGDANVFAHVNGGFGGIGNQYASSPVAIRAGDIVFDIQTNGNASSLGSHSGVSLDAKNVTVKAVDNYTGGNSSGSIGIYGILAGSTVDSGEGGTSNTSRNGSFTTITVDNFVLNQTSTGGWSAPILNSGLRAIQGAYQDAGNGSSGKIIINNALDMYLKGARLEGIYISGAASDTNGHEATSQVMVKDSHIVLDGAGSTTDNQSSAIKIGKARVVGTGKGEFYSSGKMVIDASGAVGNAIKIAVSGSKLVADGANSSADIKANQSALAIGANDWGSSTDSTGIDAAFANAKLRTQSADKPLLMVEKKKKNVAISFDRKFD